MKFVKTGIGILVVALVFGACKNVDFKKTKNGVPYKIISSNDSKDTAKVRAGNVVKFHYLMKMTGTKDTVLTTSYGKTPAYQPIGIPQMAGDDISDAVNDVLLKAKKGDSIMLTFSTDSLILRNPAIAQNSPIKRGQTINFSIKVLDVLKDQSMEEADRAKDREAMMPAQMEKDSKLIEDFMKTKNITAQKLPQGTYRQITNPGTDPKIELGDSVTVFYTGTTLKGQQFESNVGREPVTFKIGGLIKGFDEGLVGLGKGAKAKILIPSMLAYGEMPRSEVIGPFENLIFDLDIVNIKKPSAQSKVQMPSMTDTPKSK